MFSGMIEVTAITYTIPEIEVLDSKVINILYEYKCKISIDKITKIRELKESPKHAVITTVDEHWVVKESPDEIEYLINEAILDNPFYKILSDISNKMTFWR